MNDINDIKVANILLSNFLKIQSFPVGGIVLTAIAKSSGIIQAFSGEYKGNFFYVESKKIVFGNNPNISQLILHTSSSKCNLSIYNATDPTCLIIEIKDTSKENVFYLRKNSTVWKKLTILTPRKLNRGDCFCIGLTENAFVYWGDRKPNEAELKQIEKIAAFPVDSEPESYTKSRINTQKNLNHEKPLNDNVDKSIVDSPIQKKINTIVEEHNEPQSSLPYDLEKPVGCGCLFTLVLLAFLTIDFPIICTILIICFFIALVRNHSIDRKNRPILEANFKKRHSLARKFVNAYIDPRYPFCNPFPVKKPPFSDIDFDAFYSEIADYSPGTREQERNITLNVYNAALLEQFSKFLNIANNKNELPGILVKKYINKLSDNRQYLPMLIALNPNSTYKANCEINNLYDEMLYKDKLDLRKREVREVLYGNKSFNKRLTIEDIDTMPGSSFEQFLSTLFGKMGYQTTVTKHSGDQGADLIVEKSSIKTTVQAKRYAKPVGNYCVQEVVAAKNHYGCDRALVITNSFFTTSALQLAKSNNVELWDRQKLLQLLEEY